MHNQKRYKEKATMKKTMQSHNERLNKHAAKGGESSEVSYLLYINVLLFPKEQDGYGTPTRRAGGAEARLYCERKRG